MKRVVVLGVVAVFLLGSAPAMCQAQGVGNAASGAAPKGTDWSVPPGHYGLIASYADFFLANGPANGNYVITWGTLMGANIDPAKPNVLADFFIVDVRATTAFNKGHLDGAINILYAELARPSNLAVLPVGQPILLVCGTGMMSSQAGAILGMLGYNVRILSGGMAAVPVSYPLVPTQ